MPFPIKLLEKSAELGRRPLPDDFEPSERQEILKCLGSCIRDTERTLSTAKTVPILLRREAPKIADMLSTLQDDYEAFALALE